MSLSTIAGTVAGKVLIGASVAAASVSGAHAAGVVEVPVLPDVGDPANEVAAGELDVDSTIEVDAADSSDERSSSNSSTTSTSSTTTSTTTTSTVPDRNSSPSVPGGTTFVVAPRTFDVLDAGTVTIQGDSTTGLVVVSADPATGWTTEIENDELGEAGVNFRNGGDRVDFRAEFEDGQLRIRIRDRRTDTRNEFWFDRDGNAIAEPADHDDDSTNDSDDDHDDDSDDDNSGHGNRDDDHDDDSDDDDSGHDDRRRR